MFTRYVLLFVIPVAAPLARATDLNRAMILLPPSGATVEDRAIASWQQRVAAPRATLADYEQLGWAFVGKARRTLDGGCYKLAEVTAGVMDATFGASPEASLLRGHVYHNLHRFREAEKTARELVASRALPQDWALLSDALMEQGKLREAVNALQQMVNLRPGAEADTRIAHVRWLKGDLTGAIAAMTTALRETSADDQASVAWILSRLSGFYLQAGNVGRANELARSAVARLPDYAPALLAAGRAQLAQNDAAEAAALLGRAARLNPLPEYQWWLAEARRTAGDATGAATAVAALAGDGASTDSRTYALYLATCGGSPAEAVRLARAELAVRQDVHTHDALAWALFASGDAAAAQSESDAAMAEGTRDPRLLLHAALIARANGRRVDAHHLAAQCRVGAAALLPSERQRLTEFFVPATQDENTYP